MSMKTDPDWIQSLYSPSLSLHRWIYHYRHAQPTFSVDTQSMRICRAWKTIEYIQHMERWRWWLPQRQEILVGPRCRQLHLHTLYCIQTVKTNMYSQKTKNLRGEYPHIVLAKTGVTESVHWFTSVNYHWKVSVEAEQQIKSAPSDPLTV